MADGQAIDPRSVLERYNERIGTTPDPFATWKLEELRDELVDQIEMLDKLKENLKVASAGHRRLEADFSEQSKKQLAEQVEQHTERTEQLAAFLDELLEAADEGHNLQQYIAEKEAKRRQAAQAQLQGQMPGPM